MSGASDQKMGFFLNEKRSRRLRREKENLGIKNKKNLNKNNYKNYVLQIYGFAKVHSLKFFIVPLIY